MNDEGMEHISLISFDLFLAFGSVLAVLLYIGAGIISNQRAHLKKWPAHRYVWWVLGIGCIAASVIGPLAARAHSDFVVHMFGHLLLGMLAPILFVLSAPITLLLRTLPVSIARRVSALLKTWPARIISHPVITSILNIGGLWILYRTDLYSLMQQNGIIQFVISVHVFLAGYVFTASMIYIDPTPHRFSFLYRAVVFILALAGHGILTKLIYAAPPRGVPAEQAETGSMVMYYGGDMIDLILISIFCFHWFKASHPRGSLGQAAG